jgi:hypothetical protein
LPGIIGRPFRSAGNPTRRSICGLQRGPQRSLALFGHAARKATSSQLSNQGHIRFDKRKA